jgi:Reverse transcriptase (RNA-dependent DNA polymerase)
MRSRKNFRKHFDMKDMGEAKKVLGLEICRNRTKRSLTLSQAEYAASVLHRYEMGEAYGVSTPIDGSVDLYESSESASDMPYREAIGSLMYLMVGTILRLQCRNYRDLWRRRPYYNGML